MSFQNRLSKLGKDWKAASARDAKQFGSELEDGRYIARITDCEIQESMSSGRLQVMWEHTVVEGPDTNATIRSYDGIETEDGLFYLQRRIARLGKQVPENPSDLENVITQLAKEKPIVRIRVKTKGDYQNVYLDKLIGEGVAMEEAPASGGPGAVPAEPDIEADARAISLEVGQKVFVDVKGTTVEVVVTKIVDEETFKAKDGKGKEKTYTTDSIIVQAEESPATEGELSLEIGDKIRVKTKVGEQTVEIEKIIDEETFKAKGKDGKSKTFTVDQIVL
jgi:hypothetical protein